MPKASWNIVDFSGGLNTFVDKRDINANESVAVNDLIAYNSGSLKLAGAFVRVSGIDTLGFPDNNSINKSLFYMKPQRSFIYYGKAIATTSGSSDTITMTNPTSDFTSNNKTDHGLTTDIFITIISCTDSSLDSEFIGKTYNVYSIFANNFKITHTSALTDINTELIYVVGGTLNQIYPVYNDVAGSLTEYSINPNTTGNQFAIKCNTNGQFGYYDISNNTFLGSIVQTNTLPLNTLDSLPYLFDLNYTYELSQLGNPTVIDAFTDYYGILRVMAEPPEFFQCGQCQRPVTYRYIDTHVKHGSSSSDGRLYHGGWYPFKSHILSPEEHIITPGLSGTGVNSPQQLYGTYLDANPSSTYVGKHYMVTTVETSISDMDGDIDKDSNADDPTNFRIAISQSASTSEGEWDFTEHAGDFNYIGLGVSLIYDNIKDHSIVGSNSQESLIDPIGNRNGTFSFQIPSGVSARCLNILLKVPKGIFASSNINLNDTNSTGSRDIGPVFNGGQGNYTALNPRIVGANIYITKHGINAATVKELNDPLYLATFNFLQNDGDSYGKSVDHDGNVADDWIESTFEPTGNLENYVIQLISNIKSPPSLSYSIKNGGQYRHNENIHAWYKTSAICNGKLYAGNVSYFNHIKPQEQNNDFNFDEWKIDNYPDKILVSPINKFDILPASRVFETVTGSYTIVYLEEYNNFLFIYRTDDLLIYDTSDPTTDVLLHTFHGAGVNSPLHVTRAEEGLYHINSKGLFLCNGEEIANLSNKKISTDYWLDNIMKSNSRLMHDPDYKLVFITTTYDGTQSNVNDFNKLLVYNTQTGAFFLKNTAFQQNVAQSWFTNSILVNGVLYTCAQQVDFESESFTITNTTAVNNGVGALYVIYFRTTNSGTWAGPTGGTPEANQLSTDIDFLKIQYSDGKWYALHEETDDFNTGLYAEQQKYLVGGTPTLEKLQEINAKAIAEKIDSLPSRTIGDSIYSIYADASENYGGDGLWGVKIRIYGNTKNATTSLVAEDISGVTNGSIYSTATPFSFASKGDDVSTDGDGGLITSDTTNTLLNGGNLDYFSYDSTVSHGVTAPVAGVWKIQIDRGDNTNIGSIYTLYLTKVNATPIYTQYWTAVYEIGIDYSTTNNTYTYLDETVADDDTRNDNVLTNLHNAYSLGLVMFSGFSIAIGLLSENSSVYTHFDIGSITGSSGSKYFTLTMRPYSEYSTSYNFSGGLQLEGVVTSNSVDSGSVLLQWQNELPLNEAGNSLIDSENLNLETKDIDFGEPNVRKKVYKAYITYTGGQGNIECFYQADQSGSWTVATVKDTNGTASTNDNRLNTSSTQTRAELRFGTGGNNIYSFALKFSAYDSINSFEINDITIVYRLKRPK